MKNSPNLRELIGAYTYIVFIYFIIINHLFNVIDCFDQITMELLKLLNKNEKKKTFQFNFGLKKKKKNNPE